MKIIAACLMLVFPLMVDLSLAAEKVTSVEDVSVEAKVVQKELQSLYLKMRSADKTQKSVSTLHKRSYVKVENAIQTNEYDNTRKRTTFIFVKTINF